MIILTEKRVSPQPAAEPIFATIIPATMEIQVKDYDKLEDVRELVHEKVEVQTDKYGGIYFTQSIEDLHPEIFAWLGLLDMNVWVILILMIGVLSNGIQIL